MLNNFAVKIFTSQMSVSSSGFDLKDSFINGKERNIKGSSSQIKDKNMFLSISLFVQSIGNGSSSWFIDDSQDIETWDRSSIFGGLSLVIIEICRNCDDCVLDWFSNEWLSDFLHLSQNHWWNLFSLELFCLSLELYCNLWFFISTRFNLEWPMFNILLYSGIIELSTDQSLSIEDSVKWVLGALIISSITN